MSKESEMSAMDFVRGEISQTLGGLDWVYINGDLHLPATEAGQFNAHIRKAIEELQAARQVIADRQDTLVGIRNGL